MRRRGHAAARNLGACGPECPRCLAEDAIERCEDGGRADWPSVVGFCDGQDRWVAYRSVYEAGRRKLVDYLAGSPVEDDAEHHVYSLLCSYVDCFHSNIGTPRLEDADLYSELGRVCSDVHEHHEAFSWLGKERFEETEETDDAA